MNYYPHSYLFIFFFLFLFLRIFELYILYSFVLLEKKSYYLSHFFMNYYSQSFFFFPQNWDRLGHFFVFYPYNYLYSYKIKIIIIITVQATANGLHQAMTGFLNGPFPPYLLTEHLAHSLDGPGPSSQLDRTSSIIPRLRNNALGESTRRASIGT